jgi:hypothetical protein
MRALALLLISTVVSAQPITEVLVQRNLFGSGVQDGPVEGYVNALPTADAGVFQVPSYLAGNPTAGTIYPRVVTVQCEQEGSRAICDGYAWRPELGRGEYLFIRPVPKPKPPPPPPPPPAPEPTIVYVPVEVSVPVQPELPPLDIEPGSGKQVIVVPAPLPKPRWIKAPTCTPDGTIRWIKVPAKKAKK